MVFVQPRYGSGLVPADFAIAPLSVIAARLAYGISAYVDVKPNVFRVLALAPPTAEVCLAYVNGTVSGLLQEFRGRRAWYCLCPPSSIRADHVLYGCFFLNLSSLLSGVVPHSALSVWKYARANSHSVHRMWKTVFPALPAFPCCVSCTICLADVAAPHRLCRQGRAQRYPLRPCRPPETE